jgi:hypothetical protein
LNRAGFRSAPYGKLTINDMSRTGGSAVMADFDKISQQVGEVAGRLADVADAAQGKRSKGGGGVGRWLLLPAAGAVVYAAVKKRSDLAQKAKDIGRQAGEKAPDLLDVDLVARVKDAAGLEDGQEAGRRSPSRTDEQFEKNRSERAERRERRREATSS